MPEQGATPMRKLLRPLLVLLAIVFLIEAWLWEHLAPIVGWVVARLPLATVKTKIAATVERLPPYPTLLVFLVPILLLLPLKFVGLWLLAHHHWIGALALMGLAKLIGLGITAFIFDLTRPKLLQLPWFRWLYERVLLWLAWAHELVDPIKRRIKLWLRAFSPRRSGRTLRLLLRLRRKMARAT